MRCIDRQSKRAFQSYSNGIELLREHNVRNEEASRLKRKNKELEEQLANLEQQLKKKVEEAQVQDAQSLKRLTLKRPIFAHPP